MAKRALAWFGQMHPFGVGSGTYLQDINGEDVYNSKYECRPLYDCRPLRVGDVIGYCGASGWWYVYDDANCVRLRESDTDMREDLAFIIAHRNQCNIDELCCQLQASEFNTVESA